MNFTPPSELPMRSLFRLLCCTALLIPAACGGDDDPIAPVTEATVVGTWNLRGVNGDPLPFPLAQTVEILLQIRSGQVIIGADKRYTDIQELRISRVGQADTVFADTIGGSWTLVGNEMTVTVDGGGSIPILFVNNQLLKLESGFTYNYRK
jgi:hypothetical protein